MVVIKPVGGVRKDDAEHFKSPIKNCAYDCIWQPTPHSFHFYISLLMRGKDAWEDFVKVIFAV